MTTGTIDPRYGDASATPPEWTQIERLLAEAQLYWIVTVRRDGRPHTVPLVGLWHEGAFAFCTGPGEQKQRNLEANDHVAVTTGTTGAARWDSGTELVIEGTATRVTDTGTLQALAAGYLAKYGADWHYEVRGAELFEVSSSGAGGGGGAWAYLVHPDKVLAFGGEHGQTRYRP